MSALQRIAIGYLAIVVLAAGWAVSAAALFFHSEREHLLPSTLLALATSPSSLSVSALYRAWPAFFSLQFTQVAWLTLCGVFQAAVLFALGRRRPKRPAKV
jgi:hypothetical protein